MNMINLPDIKIIEQIYESANSVVYRAIRTTNKHPLILKALKEDYPSPVELYRYQYEYEITRSLNLEKVIKAYDLVKSNNTQVMLLEDFGGFSLKYLLENREFSLKESLLIALKATEALGAIHKNNIIHKDINLSNIVFNPETGQLKLIDLGISTSLLRENPTFKNPNLLEGTFAYMSPEQTGRMNFFLDYRTDFYSLGVSLYEWLTKQLPFDSEDALELIHSHIAKQPLPLQEINPEIPLPLSEIVLKLMAKSPENRYQTTWGIKADLETCLAQLKKGEIKIFPLAKQDISRQLQIPQKLYGRETQIESLLTAFARVASLKENRVASGNDIKEGKNATEVMMISGYSGIGKTAIVQELYKFITQKRGYFVSGKFDHLHRDIPYQALMTACQNLIQQLLSEKAFLLQEWGKKISAALANNGQVIIDLLPELELIIGPQPAVPELSATEATNRFNLVFQNFIQVFCKPQHPLVIFLDDLQWADSATLQLIEALITNPHTQNLLLIGAYRNNEVSATDPLMRILSDIKEAGVVVNNLALSPLSLSQTEQLITDTLKCEGRESQQLALVELISQKTQGNPFFIKEFLKSLYREKLLIFDNKIGGWSWDLEKIKTRNLTENVVELMANKIQSLSEEAQKTLQLAACIGNQFCLETLSWLQNKGQKETADELGEVIEAGLILTVGEDYKFLKTDRDLQKVKICYKFAHDRIQQAAYSLIPGDQKQTLHWKIGKSLLEKTAPQQLTHEIFEIVKHLNFGNENGWINLPQLEKDKLAELNLMAGKKAKASAAWQPAWNYLKIGINCLSKNSWVSQYKLSLEMYEEAAEAASLSGNFSDMEELVAVVQSHAKTFLEKIKIYEIKIQGCIAQNNPTQGIKIALSVLNNLGIKLTDSPTKLDIIYELGKTKLKLVGKKIANLIDLPVMTDPNKLAAMRILSGVSSATYLSTPELLPLIVLKQVNLSLKYGNTAMSGYAYATYGLILCSEAIGDIETGYQFGQLALKVGDKFNDKKFRAKTIFIVNYFVKHWKEHLKETLKPLLEAYTIGLETGDLEYAAYSACVYGYHSYVLGKDLSKVEEEMAMYSKVISQLKQESAFYYNILNRQLVLNLMGRCEDKYHLIGESYDEVKMLPVHQKAKAKNICHAVYFYKFFLCYFFQNYSQALENAKQVEKYIDSAPGTIPLSHFYNSLAHLAIYSEASQTEQKQIIRKVKANQKNIRKWAKFAPMTHLHKYYLVEAEKHRVLGNNTLAIEYYDNAIKLAKKNEYLNEEALANELAGKFYLAWGKDKIAQVYFTDAYHCYWRWGATAKLEELVRQYPQFLKRFTNASTFIDTRQSVPNSFSQNGGEIIDFATLMKASQAIASEIELDKLLATLMKILLENSGAETGYLILEAQGELRLEAAAAVNSTTQTNCPTTPLENLVPLSIINYVERTRKGIIEMNAAAEGKFIHDTYINTQQIKSILCAPLLNQGQLIGIIYLENNLAPGVFTTDRLQVIQFLSIQAAISLKNARLYAQVNENQNRLNKFFNAIPLGIVVHNATGKVIYENTVSKQLVNLQGLPPDLLKEISDNRPLYRAGTGQTYPLKELPLVRSLQGFQAAADDIELHQGEQIIPLEITCTPIFDEAGNVEYAIGAFQDITQRKQAEKTLIENISLEQEIIERKKVAGELERAKQAAEAANRAKSAFLANMSHELRTPLNAILGFSHLLSEASNLSKEQIEDLHIIRRSGNHLLTLINQILDVSKIEAGKMTVAEKNFDLFHLLNEVKDMFNLKANTKDLRLEIECAPSVPQYICTDQVKLKQVLINLLSNAIKFTNSGSVSVNVQTTEETPTQCRISFEIKDTGVGIAPQELENVFKPFEQTASGQKVSEGTGLGLTISSQFVHLMGGEISVSSAGFIYTPGKPITQLNQPPTTGTSFIFDLPVTIINSHQIPLPEQHRCVISLAENQPQYRLLVVDDNDYNRQLLLKILQPIGFEVQTAKNGQEALEIWNTWEPHLIWMDMRMPVMDGYQATKQIKSTIKGQSTPIIAVTASSLSDEIAIILSSGCDDFVSKPFEENSIFEMIEKYLKVKYIYKEKLLISTPSQPVNKGNLKEIMAGLPKTWLEKLHNAALDADYEWVLQLIKEIPHQVDEIEILRDWAHDFKFEKILEFIENI
ncbi:AAA family ATPase [Ancylothrix sp. C2]|uniref:AAA family ATPase n=1 Tax=Ancylothrix sp. D3o TaxID=2953691 RepID=UPI0021BAFA08|nr:AAA family ATPase [Ancylothrix sp. D3o]MCT7953035.1 AAA family ATPase [Ancylothrix sp. D3o]